MGIEWDRFGAQLGIALVCGIVYNLVVAHLEKKGYDKGLTSLLVVVGCAFTIGLAGLQIGWTAMWIVVAFFGATGTPMIVGSLARFVRERAAEIQAVRAAINRMLRAQGAAEQEEGDEWRPRPRSTDETGERD